MRILDSIDHPSDLAVLANEELEILAQEIRQEIIQVTAKNGGHIGSSLGAVEIILAVHSLINSPRDHFVFDVGHQSYAHKLVTGRREAFKTLRQFEGLSGFTKSSESVHDKHPSGHASDSLSVALGLAKARDIQGGNDKVVALIGDAAISGGMAFEALNHIGHDQTRMVIILNDNEMSISPNVGALMNHLGKLRTSKQYRHTKDFWQERLENSGRAGQALLDWGKNAKESIKQFVIPNSMMFENLGITCTAPVDGHNIAQLRSILEAAFEAEGPVLIHCVTKKGKGYAPAENLAEKFHGVAGFDVKTGKTPASSGPKAYTKVFSEALLAEAAKDESIVAITAAMKGGTGLDAFSEAYPDRCFDVGIAEGHATAFASGLAQAGLKPVLAIYSTFEQRGFDQIVIDNALPNHNVTFALDRAGLVGDDGPTHHGLFDIAYMRMIPHMRMLAPSNEAELVNALHTALATPGPVAVRYPRGVGRGAEMPQEPEVFESGASLTLQEGTDVALLAFGRMVEQAQVAADILAQEGLSVRIVDMRWVKPFDKEAVERALETDLVVTLEEGVLQGGVGEGIAAYAAQLPCENKARIVKLGIDDNFVEHGKVPELFAQLGLDGVGIAKRVLASLQECK